MLILDTLSKMSKLGLFCDYKSLKSTAFDSVAYTQNVCHIQTKSLAISLHILASSLSPE